jgi:hypothetical protein
VVAANECDSIWISYFEAKKEEEGLEGVETTVNKVACEMVSFLLLDQVKELHTHEEVVCVWYVAAYAEQLHKVMELAVNVTTYL